MKNSSLKLLSVWLLTVLFGAIFAAAAQAGEIEDKGFEIAARSDRSDRGFADSVVDLTGLRSFAIGVMSIIPNAVPILMAFGVWAILVGQIGMAASVVAATSLGIVVDDTVHFLTKYLRGRREKGLSRPDAIRYAFETVGQAIILTTVILTFGFAVLATSTFLINAQMGLLTALTIVIALVVDFLLLPTILMIGYKQEETQGTRHERFITQTS